MFPDTPVRIYPIITLYCTVVVPSSVGPLTREGVFDVGHCSRTLALNSQLAYVSLRSYGTTLDKPQHLHFTLHASLHFLIILSLSLLRFPYVCTVSTYRSIQSKMPFTKIRVMSTALLVVFAMNMLIVTCQAAPLIETERVEEYHKRNYTYPYTSFTPDTPGMHKLMEKRFRQIEQIPERGARYEGFIQTINAAVLAPNFTETGWGLTRAPEDLMVALRKGIREGVATARPEHPVEVIEGDTPLFIDRPDLTRRVLEELKPLHEAWAGVELTPHRAYGFRLYRNQSNLLMHVDKMETHVISCILHIDSSDDADPWPILIEDYEGNTHEVVLKSGEMLFYESSKCFHGRPSRFNGEWYSSIFVHYYPKLWWDKVDHKLEAHYAVPPSWSDEPSASDPPLPKLQMVGTSMKEPECPDEWCSSVDTVKWPNHETTFGEVITTGGRKFLLNLGTHDEL